MGQNRIGQTPEIAHDDFMTFAKVIKKAAFKATELRKIKMSVKNCNIRANTFYGFRGSEQCFWKEHMYFV